MISIPSGKVLHESQLFTQQGALTNFRHHLLSASIHLHAEDEKVAPWWHARVAGDRHRHNSNGQYYSTHPRFSAWVVFHLRTRHTLRRLPWLDTDRAATVVLDWPIRAHRGHRTVHRPVYLWKMAADVSRHARLAAGMSPWTRFRFHFHHLDTKALVSVRPRVDLVGLKLQQNRRCPAALHVWLVAAVARTRRHSLAPGWKVPYYFFVLPPNRRHDLDCEVGVGQPVAGARVPRRAKEGGRREPWHVQYSTP